MSDALKKFLDLKMKIAEYFIKMRKEAGYSSSYQVSQNHEFGYDAIFKLEKGQNVPTKRTIKALSQVYKMNDKEIKEISEMCERARKLRSEITKQRVRKV